MVFNSNHQGKFTSRLSLKMFNLLLKTTKSTQVVTILKEVQQVQMPISNFQSSLWSKKFTTYNVTNYVHCPTTLRNFLFFKDYFFMSSLLLWVAILCKYLCKRIPK